MAGSPKAGRQDPPSNWRIDRFELIYYNARHMRWQYFAEDPLISFNEHKNHRVGESPHRRQVRRLLFMVRTAIEQLVSARGRQRFEVRPAQGVDPKRVINIGQPDFDGWQRSWDEYLKYLEHTATHGERLPSNDLKALEKCFTDLSTSGCGVHGLSRNLSITLLSLLPILEEWDTWGCFLRARRAAIQEIPAVMHFPVSCADADWFQPFYVAELEYTGRRSGTDSDLLLGEDVNLEAGCCDLANSAPHFKLSERADFFKYCRRPDEANGELYLYRCYGHFVDHLIKALSGGEDGRRFFFIAYPLQAAGRLHFLQIALTTTDAAASVSTLYDDWSSIHEHFWRPECSTVLEAEQGRIALSAFQHASAESLRKRRRLGAELTDDVLKSVLVEHLYCLFPIRSAKAANQHWHYSPYTYDDTTQSGVRGSVLGYRWRFHDPRSLQYAGTAEVNLIHFKAESYGIVGTAPRIGNHVLQNTLIEQRIVQSVEQQMDYLKAMRYAIEQERRQEELEARRAGIIFVQFLESLQECDTQRILQARTLDDVQYILQSEVEGSCYGIDDPTRPSNFADRPRQAIWYLHQAYRTEDSASTLETIQHCLQPSLLEDLSWFLDSSLVKVYTHDVPVDHYFSGTLKDAKQAVSGDGFVRKHYESLAKRLTGVDESAAQLFSKACAHFFGVIERLDSLETLRYWESHRRLDYFEITITKLRGTLECLESPPLTQGGKSRPIRRFFLGWEYWLNGWLQAYWKSRSRDGALPAAVPDFVQTLSGFTGERFPFQGELQIRLFDNSLWLPCSIGTEELEDGANTVASWNAACQQCANLYLVNRNDTGQLVSLREALYLATAGRPSSRCNRTSLVSVGTSARSRGVLGEHSKKVSDGSGQNFWVILYQTWRADEPKRQI